MKVPTRRSTTGRTGSIRRIGSTTTRIARSTVVRRGVGCIRRLGCRTRVTIRIGRQDQIRRWTAYTRTKVEDRTTARTDHPLRWTRSMRRKDLRAASRMLAPSRSDGTQGRIGEGTIYNKTGFLRGLAESLLPACLELRQGLAEVCFEA